MPREASRNIRIQKPSHFLRETKTTYVLNKLLRDDSASDDKAC